MPAMVEPRPVSQRVMCLNPDKDSRLIEPKYKPLVNTAKLIAKPTVRTAQTPSYQRSF